jgi:starch-binding outer membrane protein, SusD/RagB family
MKKFNKIFIICLLGFSVTFTACLKDLDQKPYIEITSAKVYEDPNNYIQILAKLYLGLATSGQKGPAGKADLVGLDEGFSQYMRLYWKMQQLSSDEAIIAWKDGSLSDFQSMNWTPNNEFIRTFFARCFYQITLCNEFLRETTDEKMRERGVLEKVGVATIKQYRAEARFLRALSYSHAMDMFGNVPFVTEKDAVGAIFPERIERAELFKYVESELLAIEPDLLAPRATYGHADKGACWALLSKVYLNAEVYAGQNKYTEAATYAKKVIDGGYKLDEKYQWLFLADNDKSSEIVFAVQSDGLNTQTWGTTTFLVNAPIGGKMSGSDYGVKGGWAGLRTKKSFVNKFSQTDIDKKGDNRAMFFTFGQNLEINDPFTFGDGYGINKFINIKRDSSVTVIKKKSDPTQDSIIKKPIAGRDPKGDHPDTDFPMFRLGDMYLVYAEAVLRGGAGDKGLALTYVNTLRARAKAKAITATDLTLDFMLDERSRELFWEGHRRTDLIRFGKFTTGYNWPWKGNVKEGKDVPTHFALYPIPTDDLLANNKLKQNPGY